jgi:hypothetical protein
VSVYLDTSVVVALFVESDAFTARARQYVSIILGAQIPTLDPVMAGLDPAIGHPHQFANDVIAISNHPMEMAGSSPAMTGLDHCVWYVNS